MCLAAQASTDPLPVGIYIIDRKTHSEAHDGAAITPYTASRLKQQRL
jgi:hypothetical protein